MGKKKKNQTSAIWWIFHLTFTCPPHLKAHLNCPYVIWKMFWFHFPPFLHLLFNITAFLLPPYFFSVVVYPPSACPLLAKLSFPVLSQSYTILVTCSIISTGFKESLSLSLLRTHIQNLTSTCTILLFPFGKPVQMDIHSFCVSF